MARTKYSIIIFAFLIGDIAFNSFSIGSFPIRIYIATITLAFVIYKNAKMAVAEDMWLLGGFVFFYFLSAVATGNIYEGNIIKLILTRYLVSFIAAYAFSLFVRDLRHVDLILYILIALGIVNGIASSAQFFGVPEGMQIPSFLNSDELSQQGFDKTTTTGLGLGVGTFGIFPTVIKNGFFASVFALLSPILLINAPRGMGKLLSIFVIVFLCSTVFFSQQRLVCILTALFFSLYLIKINKKHFVYILISLQVPFFWYLLANFNFDVERLGRLSDISDDERLRLYAAGLSFIKNNFFFGGVNLFQDYLSTTGFRAGSAHNIFINAFIYGGVLGAICIITLYLKMLKICFQSISVAIHGKYSWRRILLGAALSSHLLNSLAHNTSIITGESIIWILYVSLIKTIRFEKRCMSRYSTGNLSG